MRYELVFFRITLLLSVVLIVLFGALAVRANILAENMHAAGVAASDSWERIAVPCQDWQDEADGSPRPAMCDHAVLNSLRQVANGDFSARDNFQSQFDLFRSLAFLAPLSAIFLFYALRWAFTGRIRPLLVKD